jgi:hypothetical protein
VTSSVALLATNSIQQPRLELGRRRHSPSRRQQGADFPVFGHRPLELVGVGQLALERSGLLGWEHAESVGSRLIQQVSGLAGTLAHGFDSK